MAIILRSELAGKNLTPAKKTAPRPAAKLDIVSCRNVLIYLDAGLTNPQGDIVGLRRVAAAAAVRPS